MIDKGEDGEGAGDDNRRSPIPGWPKNAQKVAKLLPGVVTSLATIGLIKAACQCRKKNRKVVAAVDPDNKNIVIDSYYSNIGGGDLYGTIADCKAITIMPVRWLEAE